MRTALLVAMGGAAGTLLRYATSLLVAKLYRGPWPLGTSLVNLAGCFAIGLLMGLYQERMALSDSARMFLGVGVLGGFTTFSAFAYESHELFRRGPSGLGVLYVAASVAGGLLAASFGVRLATRL
jgi:fluoride exporter